jgi:adenine phosphoribosyltransferase
VNADLRRRLIDSFRWIDPGPHTTHLVSDVSGWWRDPAIIGALGPALADLFRAERPTAVMAPEVTGFLLGPLVAVALGAGFVEAYKDTRKRASADRMAWSATAADYRGRRWRLGVRARHLSPSDRVLVVDDWVATGTQLTALSALVIALGARVVGAAAIVDAAPVDVRDRLGLRSLLRAADLD